MDPPLELDTGMHRLLDQANQALGRLDGITLLLPDPTQFLYAFVRKEAILSSQIEGTMSSLSDLLLFENEVATGAPVEDVEEAVNYIAAMNHGIESIESGRLPLCNRLLREIHALAHVQFETVHPFLDGNGRVGRLLMTLLLIEQGVLRRPLLYLSLYLKRNRDAYYERLQGVRTDGAWEEWLRFFLEGVIDVAASTAETTRGIVEMIERDRKRIHGLGRGAATALRLHDLAVRRVVVKAPTAARQLELSEPPVYGAIARLEDLGVLREVTGKARGKSYVYGEYMDILNEGTEL